MWRRCSLAVPALQGASGSLQMEPAFSSGVSELGDEPQQLVQRGKWFPQRDAHSRLPQEKGGGGRDAQLCGCHSGHLPILLMTTGQRPPQIESEFCH